MAAISKALILLDGAYGQRFLNQICCAASICSPAALVSSRKRAMHWASEKCDKKKKDEEEEECKAFRRNLTLSLDMAFDDNLSPRRHTTGVTGSDGKTSGVTGGKAAAQNRPQEGVDTADNDS